MKLEDFLQVMETVAPRELAWEQDNPGLLIGPARTEIKRVLLSLDATTVTAQEAVDYGADLLLTHHPLFWVPVRHILPDDPDTAAAYMLIRNGIGLFAAHTNLDAAAGGVNDQLAILLGLTDTAPLPPDNLGRIGSVAPTTLRAFAHLCGEKLHTRPTYCGHPDAPVSRVAVVGGSGASELRNALAAGADTLLTGELKHDQALCALHLGMNVVVAGHYETECIVLAPLAECLQGLTSDVQYRVARSESACLQSV